MPDFPPPPPSSGDFPPLPPPSDFIPAPPPPDIPGANLPALSESQEWALSKVQFKVRRIHVFIAIGVISLCGATVLGIPAYNRWRDEHTWKAANERSQSAGGDYKKVVDAYQAYVIANPNGLHLKEAQQQILGGLEECDWKQTRDQISVGTDREQINAVYRDFKSKNPSSRFNKEAQKFIEARLDQLTQQEWEDTQKKVIEVDACGDLPQTFRILDAYISAPRSPTWKAKAQSFKEMLVDRHYAAFMEDGRQNEQKKNWEAAIAEYGNAGKLKPKEREPCVGMERVRTSERQEQLIIALQEGKYAEFSKDKVGALAAYQKALQIDPDSKEAKAGIARAAADERRDQFETAMKEGAQAKAQGDVTGALAAYKRALQFNPESLEARQDIAPIEAFVRKMTDGEREETQNNLERSLVAYQNASQLAPDSEDAKVAVERIKKVLELRILDWETQALAAIDRKDWAIARNLYSQIRKVDPNKGDQGLKRVNALETEVRNQQAFENQQRIQEEADRKTREDAVNNAEKILHRIIPNLPLL